MAPAVGNELAEAALEVAGVPGESGVASTRGERTPREARVRVDRAEGSAPWHASTHDPDPAALPRAEGRAGGVEVAGRDEVAALHGRRARP